MCLYLLCVCTNMKPTFARQLQRSAKCLLPPRRSKQQPKLMLLFLLPPRRHIKDSYSCFAGGPFTRYICAQVAQWWFSHFPGGAVETRAALTSLPPRLSAGTMTLYLQILCPDIELSWQVSWKRQMKTESSGDGGGQLRWIWERLHKASLVRLSGVGLLHAESGIHAGLRCWLLAWHTALNL